jgi:type IV secretory pathway protease TraF
LPTGIYEITDEPLHRDSFVLVREPLKRLVGLPGDHIRVAAEGTYINGRLIPNSAVPKGSPYLHYPYVTMTLVEDQYWLLGSNPLSWDSRYVGPFPATLVSTSVRPVWVNK